LLVEGFAHTATGACSNADAIDPVAVAVAVAAAAAAAAAVEVPVLFAFGQWPNEPGQAMLL
jgi:hypothetical protein